MGNQTGRIFASRFLHANRAPLLVLAIVAATVLVDWRYHTSGGSLVTEGLVALKSGHAETAVLKLSEHLRDNPADSAARVGLAQAYETMGWSEEAVKQYEMTIKKATETLKQAYSGLGGLSEKLGRKEDAGRYARAAGSL